MAKQKPVPRFNTDLSLGFGHKRRKTGHKSNPIILTFTEAAKATPAQNIFSLRCRYAANRKNIAHNESVFP
jgi:hypothetical protein